MKFLFCGYRSWALECYADITDHFSSNGSNIELDLVTNNKALEAAIKSASYDAVIVAGWSWILSDDIVKNNYVVGVHPSDLPNYSGGSPLQHQIIDGLTESRATLFKLTQKIDAGPILDKEDISLQGGINEIFHNLRKVTNKLVIRFINLWPNNIETYIKHTDPPRKRLKPEDGEVKCGHTAKDLYNMIRCREDPYPNVYIKDSTGTLLIKRVEFYEND